MKISSNSVVLFTGDSITEGARIRRMDLNHIFGHGYQYTIASLLALENCENMPKFINKAYSGYTIDKLYDTWEEDVIKNKPTVVSILVGTNDAAQGYFSSLTPEETAAKYEEYFEKAISDALSALPNTKFIICEPFYFPLERNGSYDKTPHPYVESHFNRPDSGDTDELVEFKLKAIDLIRAKARDIAKRHSFTFVPLYDEFVKNIEKSQPEYFTWDGTHPTIAGHALIARQWLKYTEDMTV